MRAHLAEAFESGALGLVESRAGDSWMGVHQTNDCLIFDMAAREATDRVLYLFAGARTDIERTPAPRTANSLRDWVLQDPTETLPRSNGTSATSTATAAVAIALLEVMPVVEARARDEGGVLWRLRDRASSSISISCGRRGGRTPDLPERPVGYAIVSGSLVAFFGLPYFGQSISHAPAIVTLGAFIIAWIVSRLPRQAERAVRGIPRDTLRAVHRLFRVPDRIHSGRRSA